jgi:hypothetical protein
MGGKVIYLVVGLDQNTLAPWHANVQAVDVTTARRISRARAQTQGVALVVAAVIGPHSSIAPGGERADSEAVTLGRRLSASRARDVA